MALLCRWQIVRRAALVRPLLCSLDFGCIVPRGVTMLALAVALWQSAEQRRREVEAADAASLARLVRGVFVVAVVVSGRGCVAAVFVATMCVLLW